jgi:hypothetical protein
MPAAIAACSDLLLVGKAREHTLDASDRRGIVRTLGPDANSLTTPRLEPRRCSCRHAAYMDSAQVAGAAR